MTPTGDEFLKKNQPLKHFYPQEDSEQDLLCSGWLMKMSELSAYKRDAENNRLCVT